LSDTCKVAIVAALEREIWPLVKDWSFSDKEHDGHRFRFYEQGSMVLVCGGIGAEAARRAAQAVICLYHPDLVVSAGFAGALDSTLRVGDILIPRHVVDAGDGSRAEHSHGEGVLLTISQVAGPEQKAKLSNAFGADVVDMEAAAVARCAEAHGVKFLACKVVSDASDTSMLSLMSFVGGDGRFHVGRFLLHIAMRPWLWGKVWRIARDTAAASARLSAALVGTDVLQHAPSERQLTAQ